MEDVSPEVMAARAKLRERFAGKSAQIGGKGTARRKQKKQHKSVVGDEKKLQTTLKKVGCTSIHGIESATMLQSDGVVLHFENPKVQASPTANTYVVSGTYQETTLPAAHLLQELAKPNNKMMEGAPQMTSDLLKQLQKMGLGNMADLQKCLEANAGKKSSSENNKEDDKRISEDDDDVPELVENFEEVSKQT